MKGKPLILIGVAIAMVLAAVLAWWSPGPNGTAAKPLDRDIEASGEAVREDANVSTKTTEPRQNEGTFNEKASAVSTVSEKPAYQMIEAKSSFDPAADAERKKALPFRMFASGGTGKIVDREGNVILQSDSKNAIFKMEVSPDQSRIVVHRGSGRFDIIMPKSGELIRLPQQPPGENVLGFGSWHWLDDQTLIGVSGKTIPFRDDQVGPEREEPLISRSVLYIYDLKEQKISEVALPPSLRAKMVSVNAVDDAGHVQLRPEGREVSYTDVSLGWFEVRPRE